MSARKPAYAEVVRAHHEKTVGYLVASREPCIRIRDDEVASVRRRLVPLSPEDVAELEPPDSWIMAVVLCPGDDASVIARWLGKRRDPARVWFFAHPGVDLDAALAPLRAAGHALAQVDTVRSWRELHPLFGHALNDQVYADFASKIEG